MLFFHKLVYNYNFNKLLHNLFLKKEVIEPSVLKMWYFISKEYTPLQELDVKMKELFLVINLFKNF